jgi:DNA polymerase-1
MAPYLLLDGHSLAYRAWFALQEADLSTAAGQQTQAIYGFAGMLGRLLEDHAPAGMAVAFDRPEPTFRDGIAADYKAGRAATPEPLREQIGLIRRMVELMGVPVLEAAGYEADDVIATLASRLEAAGHDVIIVTGDRDTYQLVRDPHVKVLYNRRGVTDYVLYDEAGIEGRTGVPPGSYPFLAALRGDPSDNLPGVPGVGEKTAAKLVNTYGDIDSLFTHLAEQTPKLRASLAEHEARVRQNFALTPLVRDVPVECDLEDLRFGGTDREALESLFTLLEIRGPRDRILAALERLQAGHGADGAAATAPPAEPETVAVTVLADLGSARRWLEQLSETSGGIVVEPDWAADPGRSALNGLALTRLPSEEREVAWLPGELLAEAEVALVLAGLFGRRPGEQVGRIICYRAKELMRALEPSGLVFDGLDLDLAIAGYLADPRLGQATMDAMAAAAPQLGADPFGPGPAAGRPGEAAPEQLGFDIGGHDGNGADDGCDPLVLGAVRRAVLLASLEPSLRKAVVEAGAERLYADIERPLVRVLAEMELAGIAVDTEKLSEINDELTAEAARLEAEVQQLAGEEFNVNSTAQLRRILFEVRKLTPQKRTKTGFSTDAQSLERMRGLDPLVDTLLRYREVEKLRSTYGSGLLSEVAPDGRIHASFNQTVARTGRLSSDRPNLHNIPVRSSLGRQFREAFIPGPGAELLVADYDQIELRVIAHLAQDPGLIEAFRTGRDIHAATASRVFGVDALDVTPAMRSKAKMISYGLAYGMEAYGLSQRLSVPVEEAAEILAAYFVAFPNVKEYMSRTVADARARGYTETLFGRRRYLPELHSSNYRVRQAAERQAMNAGIQGLAADIFKVALVRLEEALQAHRLESRIVLQVHDEILVESRLGEADEVAEMTEDVMRTACELSVPLAVHVARGSSWAEAKSLGGSASPALVDDLEEALVELAEGL